MEKVVSVNDYDFSEFKNLKILKRRKGCRSKKKYYDCICAFDIETTLIDNIKQAIMYVWQFNINDEKTIIGRTWDEFRLFYRRINDICNEGDIVCFIQNLSYEWQYLRSVIPVDDVFAMDNRKVLTFNSGCFEFRCSYLLTNMSLDKFLKFVGVKNKKVEGFDYSKKRYPNTILSEFEMSYIINDVVGLVQGIKIKMEKDGDDLYTIPRTSTGYTRRIFRKAVSGFIKYMKKWLPKKKVLKMLMKAYRGGNAHLNRYYHGLIIHNAKSKDISSSYPFQLLKWKYPKNFVEGYVKYFKYYIEYGKACLFDIEFYDLEMKNILDGFPYLSKHKIDNIIDGKFDNGRVLSMSYGKTTLTEIDFLIISKQYNFKYKISNLYIASKSYLPKTFRKKLLEMYQYKTSLKGGDKYEYGKYKSMINAVYGMTVQNPLKVNYKYENDEMIIDVEKDEDYLAEYYMDHGWLPYQIGVYCSAYARAMLQSAIDSLPPEDVIYIDTDSVKYVGDHEDIFKELNERYIEEELSGVDMDGVVHYCGCFEDDGEYSSFVSLGSKKYCYEDEEGLHITTSGVNKKLGAEELGSIENYKEGFVFRKAGGTESIFNDKPPMDHIHVNGIDVEIVSNIAIMDSTYTLGIAGDYRRLLNGLNNEHIKHSLHIE